VKSFVDLHGGRIEIETSAESTIQVTCILPVNARLVMQNQTEA